MKKVFVVVMDYDEQVESVATPTAIENILHENLRDTENLNSLVYFNGVTVTEVQLDKQDDFIAAADAYVIKNDSPIEIIYEHKTMKLVKTAFGYEILHHNINASNVVYTNLDYAKNIFDYFVAYHQRRTQNN